MNSATAAECHLDLLTSEKNCDVVFVVGESKVRISCHQIFLRARSPVFEAMFSERWQTLPALEGILVIEEPDVEPSVFRQVLQFIYADIFTKKIQEAIPILPVADKYLVTPLLERCEQLMQAEIPLTDMIEVHQTAGRFGLTSLKQRAADLMSKEFSKLVVDSSFHLMDEDSLIELIQRDDLVINELDLFNALLCWSRTELGKTESPNPTDQRTVLINILPHVRFPLMSAQEFAMKVVPKEILSPEESFRVLMYISYDPNQR